MRRRGCFVAIALLIAIPAGLFLYDRIEFGLDSTQRGFLTSYLPGARCAEAKFDIVERDESIQDWGYVVRIRDSRECVESIRNELAKLGARPAPREEAVQGFVLPGHSDSEKERVTFDFDQEPGVVIWTRDKT